MNKENQLNSLLLKPQRNILYHLQNSSSQDNIKLYYCYSSFLKTGNHVFWSDLNNILIKKNLYCGEPNFIQTFSYQVEHIVNKEVEKLLFITRKFKHDFMGVVKYLIHTKNKELINIKTFDDGKIYIQNSLMINCRKSANITYILKSIKKSLEIE